MIRPWCIASGALALLACSSHKLPQLDPRLPVTEITVPLWDTETQGAGSETLWVQVAGPPDAPNTLVILVGGPGLTHEYARPLLALASSERRVVLFDPRGMGRSTPIRQAERFSLGAHAADVEAIRSALGVARIELVAHSWGGLVGLAYASAVPEHVDALVLVGSLAASDEVLERSFSEFDRNVNAVYQDRGVDFEQRLASLPADLSECEALLRMQLPAYYDDPAHPAAADLAGTRCDGWVQEATWGELRRYDLRPAMASISADTYIIHGASDPFGMEPQRQLAETLPTLRHMSVLPRCGHLGWEECPGRFMRRLRSDLGD